MNIKSNIRDKNKTLSFIEKVLQAFRKINSEIDIDTLEHDFSPRLGKYFVEGVLSYEGKDYRYERNRTDVTLLDENKGRIVVIETKRPKEDLNAEKWKTQAGKYADSATQFVGLTNGYRFLLWQINKDGERGLKVDVDFKSIIEAKRAKEDKLTTKEVEQILYLENLTKAQVWSEDKYTKFNDYYATIDVADEDGFKKLIEQLNYISNDLLRQYTYSAFDEYYAGYAQYKQTKDDLENLKKQTGKSAKTAQIAKFELRTEGKYRKYASFSGYYIWKALSNRPDDKEEENKQVFCKESIYVLINRLLFIRISEDKGLLNRKISNGGIEKLREQLSEPVIGNTELFMQIIRFSYGGAKNIYYHFYENDNPLDWYESGNGDLDLVMNKVLWILNQFNFAKVDRDILGKLYEKYLPKDERKRLGEFYTPDEVIDYILDAVEYVPNKAIEGKDLIDPACGSGGFLVRAARRLIARYAVKFEKATPAEALNSKRWPEFYARLTPKECEEIINSVVTHIHGFDINPFAVSISEMNLLFQIIDLYSKAIKENRSFKVPRFKVYETDSLEIPTKQTDLVQFYGETGKSLAKDKEVTDELKKKKYDFVVGNPPYVRVQKMSEVDRKKIKGSYSCVMGKFDIYIPFLELGVGLIQDSGKLGFINPNLFIQREYGKKIRELIVKETKIAQILDFGDSGVFSDVTNYPCILILGKGDIPETKIVKVLSASDSLLNDIKSSISEKTKKTEHFVITTVKPKVFGSEWFLGSKIEKELFEKIKSIGTPLKNIREKIHEGFITGANEIYFVDEAKAKELSPELEFMKPVPKGKDVRRYSIKWKGRYVIYPQNEDGSPISEIMIRKNPKLYQYLLSHRALLEKRKYYGKSVLDLLGCWWPVIHSKEKSAFEQLKIITPNLSRNNNFALDNFNFYFDHDCYGIILKDKKLSNYKYVLGLLNSRALEFFIKQISPYASGKYYRYMTSYLNQIPILEPKSEKEKKYAEGIVSKVDEILRSKKKDEADSGSIEAEIDNLVFDLYGITEEEEKIIEESLK